MRKPAVKVASLVSKDFLHTLQRECLMPQYTVILSEPAEAEAQEAFLWLMGRSPDCAGHYRVDFPMRLLRSKHCRAAVLSRPKTTIFPIRKRPCRITGRGVPSTGCFSRLERPILFAYCIFAMRLVIKGRRAIFNSELECVRKFRMNASKPPKRRGKSPH